MEIQALNTPSSIQSDFAAKKAQNTGSINVQKNPAFGIKVVDTKGRLGSFINSLSGFSSAKQRFVSGAAGILTQPLIDWNNKNTDEKTRKASCARIIGKIVAGTTSGVIIRWACVKLTNNFTLNKNILIYDNEKLAKKNKPLKLIPKEFSKWQQLLLPKSMKDVATAGQIKTFRGTIGTLAALFVMIFTNFLFDVPVTKFITNKLNAYFNRNDKHLDAKGGQ